MATRTGCPLGHAQSQKGADFSPTMLSPAQYSRAARAGTCWRVFSGGNQQKLISRWVAIGPRILLLDEPTRGVDVGAKSETVGIMTQMARQGWPS